MSYHRDSVCRLLLLLSCLVVSCQISTPGVRGQQAAPKTSPPPIAPDEIGKAKLSANPVEVLGGRLTVRMPQGARVETRPAPIMSAPQSEEHETRVLFDAGPKRLALMAYEAFAFSGDDFEKDVKEEVAGWRGKYTIAPLPLPAKGLKAFVVIPVNDPDHSRSNDSAFVEGAFVESDDRTVQLLDVYVNAAGEEDLKTWRAVAHQILLSAAPGKKKLQLAAGERRLFACSKDWEISVSVPKNTVTTKQDGPDFLVHRLIVLTQVGADSASILIYVGGHPDYEPGVKKGEGMMFGKKVEWHAISQGKGLQTLCKLPIPGDDHLNAHVMIQTSTDAHLKVLREAAESMKLVKSKGSTPN